MTEAREAILLKLARLGQEMGTTAIVLHSLVAERLGLNVTDHKAVGLLERDGAMTAGRLAERMNVSTGAVTGIVDRLEAAGYVRRKEDPSDRRKVVIEAIPERLAETAPLFAPMEQAMSEQCARYTDAELVLISEFMESMMNRMRGVTTQLRADGDK